MFMGPQHLFPLLFFYYVQVYYHQSLCSKLFPSFLHAVYCLLKNAMIKMMREKMSWRNFIYVQSVPERRTSYLSLHSLPTHTQQYYQYDFSNKLSGFFFL